MLPTTTHIGSFTLSVHSLAKVAAFYKDGLGLSTLTETASSSTLGCNNQPIIRLVQRDSAFASSQSAGLYHAAFLYSSLGELSRTLLHLMEMYPEYYQGSSDHLVSQAFYFADPEGNGVEIYHDRPRTKWQWEGSRVVMGSSYLPLPKFIQTHQGIVDRGDITIGHLHLKVGSISVAKRFYVDLLGFAITVDLTSALFVSAGGYHHHIGLNIWESAGCGVRTTTLGLDTFELIVPHINDLKDIAKRLDTAQYTYTLQTDLLAMVDPWNTSLTIRIHS
jgi:catechol 2,3-dioxygenase